MPKEVTEVKKKRRRKAKPTQLNQFVSSKKPRPKRPDRRQLRAIYKILINGLTETRVNALVDAVHWYDNAVEYYQADDHKSEKLKVLASAKALDSAMDLREASFQEKREKEKEPLLIKTVQKFELALKGLIRTRTIDSVYAKYKKLRTRLEKKEERLTSKYARVLDILQSALSPKNAMQQSVSLKVGDIPKDRFVSSDNRSMIYSRKYIQSMMLKYKQEGLLALVIQEIVWFARVASHIRSDSSPTGYVPDLQKEKDALASMWKNLIEFCKINPKIARRLVRVPRRPRKRTRS